MPWLEDLAREAALSVANGRVWVSIGDGLLVALVCLCFGTWLARRVGLLGPGAPAGELLGVGLSLGLMVAVSWIAAVGSGGRSAFTPVAIGFLATTLLAVVRPAPARPPDGVESGRTRPPSHRLLLPAIGAVAFVIATAHLYGATMATSPRDGVQPVEFMDEAFYSVLAADLARTGTESTLSPAGFDEIAGAPPQNWYHWGELWLAAAVIKATDADPIMARHFTVLPILLLAAALTGTIVRRLNRTTSTGAFLTGFAVCLFLAPIPWLSGPFFSDWAVGLLFGVTVYGMAAVAVPFALFALVHARPGTSWATAAGIGTASAFVLPAHLVIAALASVAIVSLVAWRLVRSRLRAGGVAAIPASWRRTASVALTLTAASFGWGLFTGHALGGTGVSAGVDPFNAAWRGPLVTIALGAGVFYAIAVAWWIARSSSGAPVALYATSVVTVAVAAVVWGARLGDFNMFHVFFGSLAIFATVAAAVAIWAVWVRVRAIRQPLLWVIIALLVSLQLEAGSVLTVLRLQRFGPGNYEPVPLEILAAIRALPADARLAYACRFDEEVSYWDARLLAIGVHGERRIVPLCFEADSFGPLVGAPPTTAMSPLFATAPHLALYPDATAQPSPDAVATFMRAQHILYIYADAAHPNSLVPDAIVVADVGAFRILRLP